MTNSTDSLYADSCDDVVSSFVFDEAVARVFPDMIRRSVPGYSTIIPMIGIIAGRYALPDTNLYDLGCSLGASTVAMRHGLTVDDCRIIAVDNSSSMLDRCREFLDTDSATVPVELVEADIRNLSFDRASVVTLNFTLQFVPKNDRLPLLRSVAEGMVPGGALVLSEKLVFDDVQQDVLDGLHLDFKRANGYSELEISQKRSAIENVLIPETLEQHRSRLLEAGFSKVMLWYQCFNFCSILAIR